MRKTHLQAELIALEAHFMKRAEELERRTGNKPKRRVPRSKKEIRQEQEKLEKKTKLEIDILISEYHETMPRSMADSIGAIYARYSTRFQSSIVDQVRELLKDAVDRKIFIPRENVFYDLAVKGWKDRRPGLAKLRAAIDEKAFQVLLLFTTSRLYRRNYKSMQFVEVQLVGRGIRAVFVKSNLDTDDDGDWQTMLQILGAIDEAQIRMIGAQVHSAHIRLLSRRIVTRTLSLGYTGEIVLGEFTRLKRPRQRMIIDVEAAVWIVRIYRWYLVEGMGFDEIARELNDDPYAPAPVRSMTQVWSRNTVRNHLSNRVYLGTIDYGRNKSVWLDDKDYCRQFERDEPLESFHFEELRIISDDVWHEVQRRIASEPNRSGRPATDTDRQRQPTLLRGIFECDEHGRQLVAGGTQGRVALCPRCRAIKQGKRPLFTHLNRQLALELTCETLASQFESSDALVNEIIDVCRQYRETGDSVDPESVATLRAEVGSIQSKIEFNRREPGESDEERLATHRLLKELRHAYSIAMSDLAAKEAVAARVITVPSPEQVNGMLAEVQQILLDARDVQDDSNFRLARRLIDDLLVGRITLTQIGERKKARGWLRGHLTISVVDLVVKRLTGIVADGTDPISLQIDYKKSMLIDEQSETAKRFWDEDLLHVEIAEQMGCIPPYVTKLIQHWHDKRELPRPNNKKRRKSLENKQRRMPKYKKIANQAIKLMEAGHSNLEIARQTKTSDTNVAKAIEWWHEKRTLPTPTAADRRNQKLKRAMSMLDGGALLTDVANELDYTPRGLRLALDKWARDNDRETVDFRSRRGNAKSGASANGKSSRPDCDAA